MASIPRVCSAKGSKDHRSESEVMALNTVIKPLISEKSVALTEKHWFSFRAPTTFKKTDLEVYCQLKYNAKPLAITVTKLKPVRRRRGKHYFHTSAYKVFRVKLPQDVKVTDFEVK